MRRYSFKILMAFVLFTSCNGNTENKVAGNIDSLTTVKSLNDKEELHNDIHIMADPATVSIDASTTAVIVVDMENEFGTKGGMFDRAGINISMIQKAVNPTAKVLDAAREAGINIIYLKMGYHPDLSDLGNEGSPNRVRHLLYMHVGDTITAPDNSKTRILIRDNWGTEIVPELKPHANDFVLYKTRFSGFYQTELDSLLKKLKTKYLIFTGCTTSVCVESTVRDAMFRDYSPVVLEDCTAEPVGYDLPRSNHQASLFIIQRLFGWVSNSEKFIKALQNQSMPNSQKLQ